MTILKQKIDIDDIEIVTYSFQVILKNDDIQTKNRN